MSGLELRVDPHGLSQLYRDAKAAEGTIQVELRRGIKAAAQPVVDAVKEDASFSSRIPGAVKLKSSFAAKGASVAVVVDGAAAPEAKAINHGGRGGTFRHPVFGNRDVWVDQAAVPFMATGPRRAQPQADAAMLEAMDRIARSLGFN